MSIKQKIVAIAVFLTIVIFIALGVYFYNEQKNRIINSYVELSRGVVVTAESTRQEMEDKWKLGLFSIGQLKEYASKNEKEKVLGAVPVVTAWKSAQKKSEELGYVFKTPKFSPRNPKNQPDEIEAEVLKIFKETGKKEHYLIDEKTNSIRYFRPVVLTDTCLYCHGDPSKSSEYWGNDNGLDPTGVKMENWKAGEIHGAFEVIQSLDKADEEISNLVVKICIILVMFIIIVIITYLFSIKIWVEKPVSKSLGEISQGSDQVIAVTNEISHASEELAEGAQKQAESVEEITSSLSEIKTTTEQNSENARQADLLAKSANNSANIGYEHIKYLNNSMEGITNSSKRIANIIKTIDEIAFQTNLLALNAAVEAARAGEHGLGFAVVAEEVRNLAQRSAEAAKDTANIIEQSLEEVNQGNKIANDTNKSFEEILEKVKKTGDIIGEIAIVSKEQLNSINQLSLAMNQVDNLTQVMANNSEKSAATTEEMNAQAISMNQSIKDLTLLFGMKIK